MIAQRSAIDDVVPAVSKRASTTPGIVKVQAVAMVFATATGLTAVAAAVVSLLQA